MGIKWTRDQEEFIVDSRNRGFKWEIVETMFLSEYGFSRTWNSIRQKYKSIEIDGFMPTLDTEIVEHAVKLAKQKQKLMDTNRIERKSFRENARWSNAIEELNKELIKLLEDNSLAKFTIKHEDVNSPAAGLVQLSDPHFNELVELVINQYDFKVASKRLKKYADKVKKYFKALDINSIVLAFTGDLMNSDRRFDEILNQATNRSKALFIAIELLEQFILDLNQDFNVCVASVTGNESRMRENIGWSEIIASDNYDTSIFNGLRLIFRGGNIQFIEGEKPTELVIDIAGQNVLLLHGNQAGLKSKVETGVQKIMGKWSDRGVKIDYIIFGHIHSTRIGDTYGRSASLVGANAYSNDGLQLISRASQNAYVFYSDGGRDGVKIDLQNTNGYIGYDINEALESYNAKSASKLHSNVTIFKVQI